METNRPVSLQPLTGNPDMEIQRLEAELRQLEQQLNETEQALNAFETQIRAKLHLEILRIRQLTTLYKEQKNAKKARRLEQKKRGKNYLEPQGLAKTKKDAKENEPYKTTDELELKRLYKEAIVHVHPDKFVNNDERTGEQATALTVELNAIYERGDLGELKDFHEHIISGNAMSHVPYKPGTAANPEALHVYLTKKRDEFARNLHETRSLHLYSVLTTYPEPLAFIDELRIQFQERIQQLEKRTRTR